jgi:hypothetical protein
MSPTTRGDYEPGNMNQVGMHAPDMNLVSSIEEGWNRKRLEEKGALCPKIVCIYIEKLITYSRTSSIQKSLNREKALKKRLLATVQVVFNLFSART